MASINQPFNVTDGRSSLPNVPAPVTLNAVWLRRAIHVKITKEYCKYFDIKEGLSAFDIEIRDIEGKRAIVMFPRRRRSAFTENDF